MNAMSDESDYSWSVYLVPSTYFTPNSKKTDVVDAQLQLLLRKDATAVFFGLIFSSIAEVQALKLNYYYQVFITQWRIPMTAMVG